MKYVVEIMQQSRARVVVEAEDLQAAIKAARVVRQIGHDVLSVEWGNLTAEIHGPCEACETECVTVLGDGDRNNYKEDGEGIRLCLPCWNSLQ